MQSKGSSRESDGRFSPSIASHHYDQPSPGALIFHQAVQKGPFGWRTAQIDCGSRGRGVSWLHDHRSGVHRVASVAAHFKKWYRDCTLFGCRGGVRLECILGTRWTVPRRRHWQVVCFRRHFQSCDCVIQCEFLNMLILLILFIAKNTNLYDLLIASSFEGKLIYDHVAVYRLFYSTTNPKAIPRGYLAPKRLSELRNTNILFYLNYSARKKELLFLPLLVVKLSPLEDSASARPDAFLDPFSS